MTITPATQSNVEPLHHARVAALFRDEQGALLTFLRCKLGNAADAQETAQAAFEKLLGLDTTTQIQSLRAYLFRIAANLAVDRLRARTLREEQPPEPVATDWHLASAPERTAAAEADFRRLREALRELPAKSARAFVMHVLEGCEFDAIARRMQLSERMVRYHVARALAHCRAQVDRTEATS